MLLILVEVYRAVESKKRKNRERKKQKDRQKIYSARLNYRQRKKDFT
jgi:hypothetical protein